jgi:hypothetical protein
MKNSCYFSFHSLTCYVKKYIRGCAKPNTTVVRNIIGSFTNKAGRSSKLDREEPPNWGRDIVAYDHLAIAWMERKMSRSAINYITSDILYADILALSK